MRFHATLPLPPETAALAQAVLDDLDASVLPPGDGPYDVYITGQGWREKLFFPFTPGAGGVVYAFVTNGNLFLSGANIEADRLTKGDYVIMPPRTLSYYLKHELTHIVQIERLGTLRYVAMSRDVREGVADYVALGSADETLRSAVAAHIPGADRLPLMQAHGVYPEFHVMVGDALANTDVETLMRTAKR